MERAEKASAGKQQDNGFVARLWRFFSSVRLALVLIMVISALSLIGALVVQVPPEIAADRSQYASWLTEVVQPRWGSFTDLLSLLGFFNVFHSFWFLAAGALLVINILVCSLNRWQNISMVLKGSPVKQADGFYTAGGYQAEHSSRKETPATAAARYAAELRKQHYRVRSESITDSVYLAADKNRHFALGTYLGHLSLILLILGFVIGGFAGFRNNSFIVTEGATREVGYGTGLSLQLNSFTDEYWPDGSPKDYRSEVVLFQNGQEVKKGVVRVNYPLSYAGIRFYQSFYGPAVKMLVKSVSGSVLYDSSAELADVWTSMGYRRPVGTLNLNDTYIINLFSTAINGNDPMIGEGELAVQIFQSGKDGKQLAFDKIELGVPKKLADFEFTYVSDGQFSGFQVSRDPGNALIWIASALFMIGVGMVLYFPRRQLWALVTPVSGGGSRIRVRSSSVKHPGAGTELGRIVGSKDPER
ncbi:MAG: cytochrome c biogenesis protein ResB [Dehalococcoidales bacterium]|nr:cytochrome c biogenesis protein ResB [Dehalococcoidales bacterium]